MKRVLVTLIITLMPAILFATPTGMPWASVPPEIVSGDVGPYVKSEIALIETDFGTKSLGDFTMKDLVSLRDRLSVAAQKDRYVEKIAIESYLLPGLGQLEVGDTGAGVGFMALDFAVVAGTLLSAYYLLPADLRFDRLNYLGDSGATISNTWNGHSFTDFLPTIGVVFGGIVVDQIVRHIASSHARGEGFRAVEEGKVTFTPRIGVGFMGLDLRY